MTRQQPERAVQQQIIAFLRGALRAQVYVLGTTRPKGDYQGTRQTPGIPDLYAIGPSWALWVECKAPKGRMSPAQMAFQDQCVRAGVPHVVGGLNEVIAWALSRGHLRVDQVAHYRVPVSHPSRPPAS